MFTISLEEKLRIVEKRLVRELSDYFDQRKEGFPMKVLAGKYAKTLKDAYPGGFPEYIEWLIKRGVIRVEYAEGGARNVFVCDTSPTASVKVWF